MKKVFGIGVVSFAFCFGMGNSAYAVGIYENPTEVSKKVLTSQEVNNQLGAILPPKDYEEFKSNFVEFSGAYQLRNGSNYYEARRNLFNFAPASALVINPKGLYYIAYYDAVGGNVVYVTNDNYCSSQPHDVIKVFASQYNGANIVTKKGMAGKNIQHDCSKIYGNAKVKKNLNTPAITMYAAESEAEKQLRLVAESIWDKSLVKTWNMNDQMARVVGTAVNEIQKCSARFNLVPRPMPFPIRSSAGWVVYIVRYGRGIVKYHTGVKKHKAYKTCITAAAYKYRGQADLASLGEL